MNTPTPPKCIAEALDAAILAALDDDRKLEIPEAAQAVWNALCKEYGWGWLPTPPGHPRAYQLGTIEAGLGGDPKTGNT